MLTIEGLCAGYGENQVLHRVSLRVEEGRVISLVGGNGAGKTTLVNAVSGLVKPSAGRVVFDGEDLLPLKPYEVVGRGVVQVPEGRRLFAHMDVRENLLLGSSTPRSRAQRDVSLKEVHHLFPVLRERAGQLAGTLSGGEQQMVAIGRALMTRPRLLIFDEPSLGLAPRVVSEVFGVIEGLRNLGLAILLIEQNVRHSLGISQYGYVLESGRIVLEGEAAQLLKDEHIRRAYLGM
ncbi:MAG: ABC transporter ATP-binding protein [Nitrospinota bacterium]